MAVLIACEESQVVTNEFRKLGVMAFSCDLLRTSGGHPEWHIVGDVRIILKHPWDLIVAFPPCTDIAGSGAKWFKEKQADGSQQRAIDFFLEFTKLDCKRVAIENPVGIMSTIYRKPDQIIQPWQFGHPESKKTCLWLKGLPLLIHTDILEKPASGHWENQTPSGQNKLGPSERRGMIRSKTYLGIARAMAEQWTKLL